MHGNNISGLFTTTGSLTVLGFDQQSVCGAAAGMTSGQVKRELAVTPSAVSHAEPPDAIFSTIGGLSNLLAMHKRDALFADSGSW